MFWRIFSRLLFILIVALAACRPAPTREPVQRVTPIPPIFAPTAISTERINPTDTESAQEAQAVRTTNTHRATNTAEPTDTDTATEAPAPTVTDEPRDTATGRVTQINRVATAESIQATWTAEEALREGRILASTATRQAMATSATLATSTRTATKTPRPSATPTVENTDLQSQLYYVLSRSNINVRACEQTSCAVITSLSPGSSVAVLGQVQGEAVSGNRNWFQVDIEGEIAYIHSSLLSEDRPVVRPTSAPNQQAQPQQQPAQQQAQPTQQQIEPQQPQQQIVPTNPPEQPAEPPPTNPPPPPPTDIPPPPAPSYACDCSKSCPAMSSCEEAYFQLNTCGCGQRDGDGDHVPCEDICPGG